MMNKKSNPYRNAFLSLEYAESAGVVSDVLTVPMKGLTPTLMIQLHNTTGNKYDILRSQCVTLMSPISLSTLLTDSFDDYDNASEQGKITDIEHGSLTSVSIMAPQDDGTVITYGLPEPDSHELSFILGSDRVSDQ